LARNQDNVSE